MLLILRVVALALDLLILFAILAPIALSSLLWQHTSTEVTFVLLLASCIVYFWVGDTTLVSGRTVGRKVCGIVLRSAQSQEGLSLQAALLRRVANLSFLFTAYLLGIAVSPDNDAGSLIAGPMIALGGLVIVPISVGITWGRAGIHDAITRSTVQRTCETPDSVRQPWTAQKTLVLTAATVTVAAAFMFIARWTIWASPDPFPVAGVMAGGDRLFAPMNSIVNMDKTGLISKVAVHSSRSVSASDIEELLTPLHDDDRSQLTKPQDVLEIHVLLAPNAYGRTLVRAAALDGVATALAPYVVSQKQTTQFMSICLGAIYTLGPFHVQPLDCTLAHFYLTGSNEKLGVAYHLLALSDGLGLAFEVRMKSYQVAIPF